MMRLRERVWIPVLVVLLVVCGVVLSFIFWDCLEAFWDWLTDGESGSATIRNLGLVLAGIIALPLAIWRGIVADKQATTARRSLLNERYQRGAEMLGNSAVSVRMGGIYALALLAKEHPEEYHIQIMELLCSFVRHPTEDTRIEYDPESDADQDKQLRRIRADVEYAVLAIGSRSVTGIELEQKSEDAKLYLRDVNLSDLRAKSAVLSRAWLTNANLSGAILPRADLSRARLRRANLSGAQLRKADLSDAKFWGADLSEAMLQDADMSGADLCGVDAPSARHRELAKGLIQAQLDEACADPDNPPKLDGVLDAKTGKPLVWRGQPCVG